MFASAALLAGYFSWYSANVMQKLSIDPLEIFANGVPEQFQKYRAFRIDDAKVFEAWHEAQAVNVELVVIDDPSLSTVTDNANFLELLRTKALEGLTKSAPIYEKYLIAQFDPRRARLREISGHELPDGSTVAYFSTRTNDHHAFFAAGPATKVFLSKTSREFPVEDLYAVAQEVFKLLNKDTI
jgi:hypothetical protein